MGSSLTDTIGRTSGGKIDMPERDLSREWGQTTRAFEQQAPGMLEAWRSMRPEQTEMLETMDRDALGALARGGRLSPEEIRDAEQAARRGMNVRGRGGDNLGVFQEAMNRYGLRRQREMEARGQAVQAIGTRQQAEPVPEMMMGQAGQAYGQQFQGEVQRNIAQGQIRSQLFGEGVGAAGAAIGGVAMMMSDERTKADVEKVGEVEKGLGLYEYRYKWDRPGTKRRGVMAQEAKRVRPEAVVNLPGGRMAVDYARI
jgi:hypothetical protein